MQVYAGKRIVNAVFVPRRHTENFISKSKIVFDWIPREAFCFTLTQTSVLEYLVDGIISLNNDCKTAASVNTQLSDWFSLKIVINQVSA